MTHPNESIAILLTGAIRNHVDKDFIFNVISNIREQFAFIPTVHIYFGTWKQLEKPTDIFDKDYVNYDNEFYENIKNVVDYFFLFERPNDFSPEFNITRLASPEESIKIYRMFSNITLLCDKLLESDMKYNYICRYRNDIILKADFPLCIDNIRNGITDYETTPTFWTFNDCISDQFCIAKQDDFFKIWYNSKEDICRMFTEWNETPEKLVLIKVNKEHLKLRLFIPLFYNFKGRCFVDEGRVIIANTNGYMHRYLKDIFCRKYGCGYDDERIATFI